MRSPISTCCACRRSPTTSRIRGLRGSAGEDQFTELARLLPGYIGVPGVAVDEPGEDGRRRRFGNMILSRLPVRQVFRHLLPNPVDPASTACRASRVEAIVSRRSATFA